MMDKKAKIYISGHNGMVGSAFVRLLRKKGYRNLLLKSSRDLDLTDCAAVNKFMKLEKPEYVFLFAARIGGIKANIAYPAEFLYQNLMIEANVIHASHKYNAKKLLFLGSSCIYPRVCPQPMKEEYLLSGKLEPTNEGYALAKIAGLKLCEYYNKQYATNFISLMPPNLYGPNDNFDFETSHVIAALIRKFSESKKNNASSIEVWGSGNARREFLYVEDLAKACLFFINNYNSGDLPHFINTGCGEDVSIKELAGMIKSLVGFEGKVRWNTSLPDGMPQKLLDTKLANRFGWKAETSLKEGLQKTIIWYRNEYLLKQKKQ